MAMWTRGDRERRCTAPLRQQTAVRSSSILGGSGAISPNAPENPKPRSLRLCDRIDRYKAHVRRHRELARNAHPVANVDLPAICRVEYDCFWRKVIGDRLDLVSPRALGHVGLETRLLSRRRNEPHAAPHIIAADV